MPTRMKLHYVVNARIPTEKAHGIQITNMCKAFADQGADVELVVPRRLNPIIKDTFDFYGIERTFRIVRLPTLDLVRWNIPGAFFVQTITFGLSTLIYLLLSTRGSTIVYSRGEMILFLSWLPQRFKLFWESHIKPASYHRYRRALTVC